MKKLILTLALMAIIAAPVLADRSVDGSYAELVTPDPAIFEPGNVYLCEFFVFNGSFDGEWLVEVDFTFPCCFNVLNGWYDDSQASNDWAFDFFVAGDCNNVAYFMDGDGGNGEIFESEGGIFYLEVEVPLECECNLDAIGWYLLGDLWGDEPHETDGFIDIEICDSTPTGQTDWSMLKALY